MRTVRRRKGPNLPLRALALIACLLAAALMPALAWVFPEHRDIAEMAVMELTPDQRAQLDKLWEKARTGHETRLCASVADSTQGLKPTCVDFVSWTAIAGDHSCSAQEMLNTVLDSSWILGVERVAAKLKEQLAAATRRDQKLNAVQISNILFERVDPEYSTRATSNDAHFLLARPDVAMEALEYARLALGPHADLNSLATYLWFHMRALGTAELAVRAGNGELQADAVRAALADEAFALHFIEDSFAAGHVAGNWGSSAVRLGTHDYYSEHGLALSTWSGKHFVAMGDAYMTPEDQRRAALAVHDSLVQLLDAFAGKFTLHSTEGIDATQPDGFDVCHEQHFTASAGANEDIRAVAPILGETPMPALGAGLGSLPRFRAELGPFIGLSAAVFGGALQRGFGPTQTSPSGTGGLETAFRAGLGLEGVLNESSDGLVFAEVGLREDRHAGGVGTVPGRSAWTVRLRMPFWIVPGDLLVAVPALAFTSRRALTKVAVESANGGLIPIQAALATRFGRIQFMLGREVAASFYHSNSSHPLTIPTPGVPPANATLVTLDSVQFEFPFLDYRVFRSFSLNQSSAFTIQPYVGFDMPTDSAVVSPDGAPRPSLHTVNTIGLRVVFDWRHYF